ncbi:ATP-binding protein [Kiloniella sp.]|uniref:HAMP domain-containing sensor histidine kinase n=1 Tax=Kiloniella sp. TaxID=1938587 RepID=UPI003B017CB0
MPDKNGEALPLRNRIAYKQTQFVVLLAFGLGLLFSLSQIYVDYLKQNSALPDTILQVVSTVKQSAAEAAFHLDPELARQVGNGLFEYTPIFKVQIVGDLGNDQVSDDLVLMERPLHSGPYHWFSSLLFGDQQTHEVSLFMEDNPLDKVGVLTVVAEPYLVASAFIDRSINVLLFGILRTGIFALFVLFFFYYTVTKPLTKLSNSLSDINPEKPSQERLSLPKHHEQDEFGVLTRSANRYLRAVERHLARRTEAEGALYEANEELENRVAERTAELETKSEDLAIVADNLMSARDELEELNAQKDKFFSIIAHDLKGPFNALLGYASLLSDKERELDRTKMAEYGGAVHKSAVCVFRLLENLLEWSRLQMGHMEFHPKLVDLQEIIDSNLELFAPIAEKKAIELSGNGDPAVGVFADKHMVSAVVRNLINNAIKFTPVQGKVTISVRRNDKWAEVDITDTGVGIPESKGMGLFRVDKKTSTTGTGGETGTGLGLPLCKDLVERQGGEIQVESNLGEGSTFSFTLPLHNP